jgi:hypothetical protein
MRTSAAANTITTSNPDRECDRVRRNTSVRSLEKIDDDFRESIRYYSMQPPWVINARLRELEKEWSVERWLETNASALAFLGIILGLTVNRKWLAVPVVVTGFLFQHAVQGWCPPLPILREWGVRTRGEIDREKFALKFLRGDFKDVKENPETATDVTAVLKAVTAG